MRPDRIASRHCSSASKTRAGPVIAWFCNPVIFATEPSVALDYAEVVRADDLTVPHVLTGELRLLVAARVGPARLIDNIGVSV